MIRLAGVTKAFRDGDREVPVLRGVDLEVAPGELVAIVGASGSGKSTLLYVAGALDSDYAGEVTIADTRLAGLSAAARAELRNRAVGFVFQSFNLLQGLSALENVMLPGMLRKDGAADPSTPPALSVGPAQPARSRRARGGRTREVRAGAAEALGRVGLADKAAAPPSRLSGGERQRVAIARAIFARPRVLLADEPTGNLDAVSGEGIIRLFAELAAGGLTVLVVTHEERVSRAASRVLHLEDGRLRT